MLDRAQLDALYRDHADHLVSAYAAAFVDAGVDGALLHSGRPQRKHLWDDQYWPLRVDPHFQHWLPLAEPDCAVLVTPGRQPRLTLYRNTAISFWEAPPAPESDHFFAAFDVVDVADPDRLPDLLPAGVKLVFLGQDVDRAAAWGFEGPAINPRPLVDALDAVRTHKTAYEIACLAEANARAARGHHAVLDAFADGDYSELQLHLRYLEATGQDDPETPYKNIVALGAHAATLHHVSYGRRAVGAGSILIDAGATCHGYHSDITRTAAKGDGAAAGTFAALVARMDQLQREVCDRIREGVPYQQLHNQSHELLAPVLRDLGIARAADDELVDRGVTRAFFPHGLGHSLGLQTHDVGCATLKPEPRNPFLRNTSDVSRGQVFTIEPGCYFIAQLLEPLRAGPDAASVDWRLVDELSAFGGVRVEDDIAVVDGGVRNLTREHL